MKNLAIFTLYGFIFMATVGHAVATIHEGGSCDHDPTMCEAPLSCVGNYRNKRCFMKKGPGMKCGQDPFWVCQDGLQCCEGLCKTDAGMGERCGNTAKCEAPLSCVGSPNNLRCFEKRGLGMNCGKDPFWVCEDGLACCEGVCATGAASGKRCGGGVKCGAPLSCVGNPSNLRCFKKKVIGMACGKDPFWVCEDGLLCEDKICKKIVGIGGRCGSTRKTCRSSLVCVGGFCQRLAEVSPAA